MAIALSRQVKTHVLLEGTLRRAEITIATARDCGYRAAGFVTNLQVVALSDIESRFYIAHRYLNQLEQSVARYHPAIVSQC